MQDGTTPQNSAGGSRTHTHVRPCRTSPVPLATASSHSVSSPGIEPGLQPSEGRVRSGTLQGHSAHSHSRIRESATPHSITGHNSVATFRNPMGHPARFQPEFGGVHSSQCPRQESNLVYDLRKVACDPAHSGDFPPAPRRGVEPRPTVSKTVMPPTHPQGSTCLPSDVDQNSKIGIQSSCRSRARTGPTSLMKAGWAPAHLQ